jgi:hypothetical protein
MSFSTLLVLASVGAPVFGQFVAPQLGVQPSCVNQHACTDPVIAAAFENDMEVDDDDCFGVCAFLTPVECFNRFEAGEDGSRVVTLTHLRIGDGNDVVDFGVEDLFAFTVIEKDHAQSIFTQCLEIENEGEECGPPMGGHFIGDEYQVCPEQLIVDTCPPSVGLPPSFTTDPRSEKLLAVGAKPNIGAIDKVHENFEVRSRFDMINTQGPDYMTNGDTPLFGAARAIATFTYTGPAPTTAVIRLENVFEEQVNWLVEQTSEGPGADTPSMDYDFSTDETYYIIRPEAPDRNHAPYLISLQGACDLDAQIIRHSVYEELECGPNCCFDEDELHATEYLVEFVPGETKSIAAIVEVYLSAAATDETADDFHGLTLAKARGDLISGLSGDFKCGFDPAWFADLTATERAQIANYKVPAAVRGDVHLVGFNGIPYAVYGLHNRWHSLYSDTNIQVNVLLQFPREKNVDWTGSIIKEVAVMSGPEWRFRYDALATGSSSSSGIVYPTATALPTGGYQFGKCGSVQWTSPTTLAVLVAGYNVTITRNEWTGDSGSTENFLDVAVDAPAASHDVSGFLGDTWTTHGTEGRPLRSLNDADYLVSGPFAADDKYNNFDAQAPETAWAAEEAVAADACGAVRALYSATSRRAAASRDAEEILA